MATAEFTMTIDDAEVSEALVRLTARTLNLKPAFEVIGASLVTSTQIRAEREQDPDGEAWAPNAASTLIKKRKKGIQKILQSSGLLIGYLTYLASRFDLAVGTNRVYGAIQQFGGTEDMAPGPAAIPARPFLGLTSGDEAMIGRTLVSHFGTGL